MSKTNQRANEARELLENPIFVAVIDEIKSGAVALFLNPQCDNVTLERAHNAVRSVQTILDALQARITDEAIEIKKRVQDRHGD